MNYRSAGIVAAILLIISSVCTRQAAAQAAQAQPAPPSQAASAPPATPSDPVLTTAENLIGKALFLRGFYASNSLSYDAAGSLTGADDRRGDWTLAGVNVLKATRRGTEAIELEGLRAAIRYNPEAHEFQRHPQNSEQMRLLIQLAGMDPAATARQLRAAFSSIFSVGIDPALQHSMPPLWSHFFDPNLPWPPDALTGQTIYPMLGQAGQPRDVTMPLLAHRVDTRFTDFAARDKVTGQLQLRLVVDVQGLAQRVVVAHPLGYGLEEQAAETVAKWRFDPAIRQGLPVAAAIVVNLDFETAPARR